MVLSFQRIGSSIFQHSEPRKEAPCASAVANLPLVWACKETSSFPLLCNGGSLLLLQDQTGVSAGKSVNRRTHHLWIRPCSFSSGQRCTCQDEITHTGVGGTFCSEHLGDRKEKSDCGNSLSEFLVLHSRAQHRNLEAATSLHTFLLCQRRSNNQHKKEKSFDFKL